MSSELIKELAIFEIKNQKGKWIEWLRVALPNGAIWNENTLKLKPETRIRFDIPEKDEDPLPKSKE